MSVLTIRFFAGARAAAGVPEAVLPGGGSLAGLADTLAGRHGDRLGTVLKTASFLVDGVVWRDRSAPLPETAVVDVLPPFAGG